MLASAVVPASTLGAANYGAELTGAYEYAFSKGITTMTSIDSANMYGEITRGQLAKMISNWAEKELSVKADETKVCSFSDAHTAEGDLATYLKKSCQMGLMGQGIDAFRPNAKVTRAEFGTVLSRALWGNKYEGATPYYANHLQALKDAGIMTRIETPSQLEIRGYVMLMLQRATAENLINKIDNNTGSVVTGVVKAGDLKVTANAATNRRIVDGAVSDLDTVTFTANEDITLDRVVLERYGYSSASDIESVWLENAQGQKVTNERSVNSKDEVSLSVTRDYRAIGKKADLTIVVRTTAGSVNKTIGFKVKAVESSAKNLDLSSYAPFTYDVVNYTGSKVTVEMKGADRRYNYAAGKTYEVARLQVKAPASEVVVKGFTLVNSGAAGLTEMDIERYLDKVEVTVDGKAVSNLTYSVDRNDNLVVAFADTTVEMKKNVTFVVSASFKTLDRYGEVVSLVLRDESAINAVEAKTQTRVTVDNLPTVGKTYTFNGSEVKLTNTKLASTIDAAAGSEDVVIAEGTVSVADVVDMKEFTLVASHTGIDTLTLMVNGTSEDAVRAADGVTFTFRGVTLEKNATVKLVADLVTDMPVRTITFTPATISRTSFANARYEDSNEPVANNVVGSIAISTLRVQAARGSLSNTLSKSVDFVTREQANGRVLFDGTYTAQKQDVTLKSVAITGNRALEAEENVTFHVYVNGTEVQTVSLNAGDSHQEEFFTNEIAVAKGTSVAVKVVADGYFVRNGASDNYDFTVGFTAEDKDNNVAGNAQANMVQVKNVESSSVTVADSSTVNKNDVVLRSTNLTLGRFTVKPANGANEADLNTLEFNLNNLGGLTADDVEVRVAGVQATDINLAGNTFTVENLTETIPAAGIEIVFVAKRELAVGDYTLTLSKVNATTTTNSATKMIVDALVKVTKMENLGGDTRFTLSVEKYDDSVSVANFVMNYASNPNNRTSDTRANVDNGTVFNVAGDSDANLTVNAVSYDVNGTPVTINKTVLEDYFMVNGTSLKVFRA